jgi:hypothetical protein
MAKFTLEYVNRGRSPRVYPSGANIDLSHGEKSTSICDYSVAVPGLYHITCNGCGTDVLVNLAGFGTVKMACKQTWGGDAYGTR